MNKNVLIVKRIVSKSVLQRIALVVSLCILVFSLYNIAKRLYGYYHSNKQYEEIRTQLTSANPDDRFGDEVLEKLPATTVPIPQNSSASSVQKAAPLPYRVESGNTTNLDPHGNLSDYTNLKKENEDMAGWIYMPGFKKPIDYPVMHAEDNEFYLYKDFFGNYSYAGSIFMDSRNNPLQVDRHIIIYGHSMKDFSMFGNLKEYPKQPENHTQLTKIYLDLMNTRLQYEVFSTYLEHASFNYRQTNFNDDNEYKNFLDRIRSKSVHKYNVKLTPMDKILTLSTCNNSLAGNGRSIIHARLVRQITYDDTSVMEPGIESSDTASKEAVSANVYLMQLSLKYGPAENPVEAVLSPPFDTVFKEFSTQLEEDVENVSLDIQTADPEAKVYLTLNEKSANPESLPLEYGDNIIKAKLVSRDGQYARTYTIKATRGTIETEEECTPKEQEIPDIKN